MKYIYKYSFSVGGRRFCCNVRNVCNALAVLPTLPIKNNFPYLENIEYPRGIWISFITRDKEYKEWPLKYINKQKKMVVPQTYDSFNNWYTLNVNKKTSDEIICVGGKGGVSLQCDFKLQATSSIWGSFLVTSTSDKTGDFNSRGFLNPWVLRAIRNVCSVWRTRLYRRYV